MNILNNLLAESIPYQHQFQFVGKREISKLTGLSGHTLKKYRLKGLLSQDIHWIRINSIGFKTLTIRRLIKERLRLT